MAASHSQTCQLWPNHAAAAQPHARGTAPRAFLDLCSPTGSNTHHTQATGLSLWEELKKKKKISFSVLNHKRMGETDHTAIKSLPCSGKKITLSSFFYVW